MTSGNFNALQSTLRIYRDSDKVFDDLYSERPNPKGLLQLEPEFRACNTYAKRIAFFEMYKLDDFLSLHCDVNNVQIYLKGVFQDEPKLVTTENLEEGHILTLSPMTRSESIDFVAWALSRRTSMKHAPYDSQSLISAFQDKYSRIQSKSDKDDYLAKSWVTALEWKNLYNTDDLFELHQIQKANDGHLPVEQRMNIYLKVHLRLYVLFMNQLKNADSIELTDYYAPGQLFISWSIVDTYLFAKANYEFALYMEQLSSKIPPSLEVKLTHHQIALLHHLNGKLITSNNANEIARAYGQTSGQSLAKIYKDLKDEGTRTAPGKYTIENYNKVIPLLSASDKEQADRELAKAIRNNHNKVN